VILTLFPQSMQHANNSYSTNGLIKIANTNIKMATLRKYLRLKSFFIRRKYSAVSVIGFHAGTGKDSMAKCYIWYPACIISDKFTVGKGHICLILNREIKISSEVVKNIWQNAKARCTVDGGTNHWRMFLQKNSLDLKPPDVISGDFDSITEESAHFFDSVPKVMTPDQSETDFTKSIEVIKPIMDAMKINDIVVFHETSGRFDQIMGNINTLLKLQSDALNIYLLASNSMTWVLRPGKHTIHIPTECLEKRGWCSLLPIGKAAHNVTTKGLRWNLANSDVEFGGLVSTSNTYADETVVVETKDSLVWSMGILKFGDV